MSKVIISVDDAETDEWQTHLREEGKARLAKKSPKAESGKKPKDEDKPRR